MKHTTIFAMCLLCLTASAARAINIEFDYTYDTYEFDDGTIGFFNKYPQARADLATAAKVFERFQDQLDAIVPSSDTHPNDVAPGGPYDIWAAEFTHPSSGASLSVPGLVIPENTVRVFAGGFDLGGSTVGRAGSGGSTVFPTTDFGKTVRTRGQGTLDELRDPDIASEVTTWGGRLSFDTHETDGSERQWNFGDAQSPGEPDRTDFLSIAIHELGHMFGFSSNTASFVAQTEDSAFTGEAAMFYNDGNPVPLHSDLSHFAENTESTVNGITQETSLDPNLTRGDRKLFTQLDYAVMRDLGWTVPLLADANLDGEVGIADLALLSESFGLSAGVDWPNGDFNLDGEVGIADLALLSENFGLIDPLGGYTTSGANVVATPQPAAGVMLLTIGLLGRRRRRPATNT